MKRIIMLGAGAGLVGFGLLTAAPAVAQPDSPVDCNPASECIITSPLITDTIENYKKLPGETSENWQKLPSDTVTGWGDAIHDTIRNYTGNEVGPDPDPST